MYEDDLVLCSVLEEDLSVMVRRSELYKRRVLKGNADESNVMVLGWDKRLMCGINMYGRRLERLTELSIWDLSVTGGVECWRRKETSDRKIADPIRSLVNEWA